MASPPKAFNPPPNFLFTKEEYGKKLTNLEYRIQRIKKRNERKSMSLLMAEIIDNAQEKKPQPSSSPEDLILPPDGQYICDECNSNERTPYQLCEHKAIYHSSSDQRAWKCVYCKTKFGRRGGLRRHVQMVHMQMMHKCPIKSCTHPGYKCTKALNAHMKTHIRSVCEICEKEFPCRTELDSHMASIHSILPPPATLI